MKPVKLAILGLGTVGAGAVRLLQDNAAEIARICFTTGCDPALVGGHTHINMVPCSAANMAQYIPGHAILRNAIDDAQSHGVPLADIPLAFNMVIDLYQIQTSLNTAVHAMSTQAFGPLPVAAAIP